MLFLCNLNQAPDVSTPRRDQSGRNRCSPFGLRPRRRLGKDSCASFIGIIVSPRLTWSSWFVFFADRDVVRFTTRRRRHIVIPQRSYRKVEGPSHSTFAVPLKATSPFRRELSFSWAAFDFSAYLWPRVDLFLPLETADCLLGIRVRPASGPFSSVLCTLAVRPISR